MHTSQGFLENLIKSDYSEIIRNMQYFDIISLFGPMSLHPGGVFRTADLIENAKLVKGQKILEIGSGTGFTTATLLNLGFDVTVIECNQNLLNTTLANCKSNSKKQPKFILGKAEDIHKFNLDFEYFDAVFLECAFGFINEKAKFLTQLKKSLKHDAKILLNDIHYVEHPCELVMSRISNALNHKFEVLFEDNWKNLFSDFTLMFWNNYELSDSSHLTSNALQQILLTYFPSIQGLNEDFCESIANRLNEFYKIFNENKKFCKTHIAMYKNTILN